VWRWVFYLVAGCAILIVQAGLATGSPVAALVVVLIISVALVVLSDVGSMRGGVNPFTIYALFAIVIAVVWGLARALSVLGPFGVIAIIVVLGGLTAWLTLTRGEALRCRRETMGLCVECGYDLRASPDVCPECGSIVNEELKRRRRIAEELSGARTERESTPPPHASSAEEIPTARGMSVASHERREEPQ